MSSSVAAAAVQGSGAASALRVQVLAMYRGFFREARGMPTANRRQYIEKKVRADFRKHAGETRAEELEVLVAAGETALETARVQRAHLVALAAQGNLKGPK